jgi:hypothetical protein
MGSLQGMAYRTTKKAQEICARMRTAKERKRLADEVPDYPPMLPDLRRTIIIIDHDFGDKENRIELYKTSRIDCFRAIVNGKEWKKRIGFSGVLEGIRKSMPRLTTRI